MKNLKKKRLIVLLVFVCLLIGAVYSYQLVLTNFTSRKLQATCFTKLSSTNAVSAQKEKMVASKAKKALVITNKVRIIAEREKYELFLKHHPFNNRLRSIYNTEVGGEGWEARKETTENKPDRPDLAFEQDFLRTMDPALQRPTPEVLTDNIKKNHPPSLSDAITPRMPGDNSSVETNWKELGPNNVGGRTRALTWDPNTPNKVWAGGVTGGLWYNNDFTGSRSGWVKMDDLWSNLAITKIAFDPTNTQNIYVATGEGYQVNSSQGAGIWKSSDGGTSWTQLNATKSMTYINDLIVRNESGTGVVYAAIDGNSYNGAWSIYQNTGLYRSTNGGTSWSQVMKTNSNPPGTGIPYTPSSISIAADNRIWVGTKASPYSGTDRGGGCILYSDNGTSWTIAKSVAVTNGFGRVSIATAPSNADYIYAFIEKNTSSGVSTISLIKSTDKGVTWSDLSLPDDADDGIAASDFSRGQAWYNQVLKVDPINAQTVYVGAIDLFKSTDEGTSWSQISKWANATGLVDKPYSIVHADHHAMEFKPGSSSEAIFGNDGGVFYCPNLDDANTKDDFISKNTDYNVTQFYSAAINPIAGSNGHMAGAQDNGTHKFTNNVINYANDVSGGDGGFCFIDQTDSLLQINSYVYNQFYLSRNGGKTINSFKLTKGIVLADKNTGSFINPAAYDSYQHALYTYKSSAAGGGSIYLVKNITTVSTTLVPSTIAVTNLTSAATAFKVSPYTTSSTTLFIGTSSGKLIKLTNANNTPVETNISGTSPNALPVGSISCIEIGRDENELLVTFFNYGLASKIYYSSNGGATWTSKMGNFPNMPVRWALFNPNHPATEVLLATELGIYGTANFDNNSPTWSAKNTGFANVRTDMLQMRTSDYMVIAATHGRGLFSSLGFSEAAAPTISSFTPVNAAPGETVTITGTNLNGATAISFGGIAASSFIVNNSTNISAVVNSGICGGVSINVTTPGGMATKTGFTSLLTAPLANVTNHPTCSLATGTIAVSSSTAGLTFSINGTDYSNTNGIFTSVLPATYSLTAKNASGCISAATSVAVNAQPATPAAPTANVSIQPTCSASTGTVALSGLPASGNWTVTATGGATTTGSGTTGNFSGLAEGTYNFTLSNGACTSTASASVAVNAQSITPSTPTANVSIQPTCSTSTATVALTGLPSGNWTVTATGGATITGTGTNGTFSGLAAGTYTFTAYNGACTSVASTGVTVTSQPATPAAPSSSVTIQPTCSTPTGTVYLTGLPAEGNWTVTATGGATITGTGTNGTFSGLAAGTYTFTVTNGTCTSPASSSVTVNAQPTTPAAPAASVTIQPTCSASTGTVALTGLPSGNWTVTATDGATITGTGTNGTFNGLAAGTYTFTVTNSTCTSPASSSVTVNAQPTTPATPTASVIIQPTCSAPTGTVALTGLPSGNWTVTATGGATITGIGTNGTFSSLATGAYTFTVYNGACTSVASSSITVNAPPVNPAVPTAGVTAQPSCTEATGTITVKSSTTGLTFSIDGIDYSNTNGIFTTIVPGTYNLTAKNANGCTSAAASITVNAAPEKTNNTVTLTSATGSNNQTTCINTAIANITYATTGAKGATFSGLPASVTGTWANNVATISGITSVHGAFNYTVTLTGGCGDVTASGTITATPNNTITLSSSAGSDNQSNCTITPIAPISYSTWGATGAAFSGLPDGVTGKWSAEVATISGTPALAGTYNYTVTLVGGCGNITAAGTIIAKEIAVSPTITAGSSSFCPGGSMVLSSSALTGNQWYKDGNSIAGANAPTYAADAIGNYTVTNFINGCTSYPSAAKIITSGNIASPPIISSSGNTSFCVGVNVNLASNHTNGIQWRLNGSDIAGATNAVYTASAAGNYTLLVTENGCTSAPITVTLLASPNKPILSAASATSFCSGGNVTLISNETSGNIWYKDGVLIAGATGSSHTAAITGAYTDTLVNSLGCKTGSLPINVSVRTAPAKPVIAWNGSNLSTNSSATAFQWSVNNVALYGATQSTYRPLTIGLYKIQVANSDGCTSVSDSFNLVVTALSNPATTNVSNPASVFPNPASPVLLVKFREVPNTTLDIRLVTNDGRTVQLVRTKDKLTSIPINNLLPGKYYIRITGKNYNQTEAVIIGK